MNYIPLSHRVRDVLDRARLACASSHRVAVHSWTTGGTVRRSLARSEEALRQSRALLSKPRLRPWDTVD
jgi:hypothetical protein